MKYLFLLIVYLLTSCSTVNNTPSSIVNNPIPTSELGHIDVIFDSITFFALKNSSFLKNEFGIVANDTMFYGGKPSYDMYILGQLNFLHISLAKGFWNNQAGGGVIVFQTQKPGMIEPLLAEWKRYYDDSLFVHTYKGNDFTLDEIMAWYKRDTTKERDPHIFANLTSYSKTAYQNWGITDSIIEAGQSMKAFMDGWGGKDLQNRLFNSITELHLQVNQTEFREIRSSLLATGYIENKGSFTHSFNPPVYLEKSENKGKHKYTKVRFRLSKPVEKKEIVFSEKASLSLSGQDGWLILK